MPNIRITIGKYDNIYRWLDFKLLNVHTQNEEENS